MFDGEDALGQVATMSLGNLLLRRFRRQPCASAVSWT
jgi:hypothetical protein